MMSYDPRRAPDGKLMCKVVDYNGISIRYRMTPVAKARTASESGR
jgi:hypothetical protein